MAIRNIFISETDYQKLAHLINTLKYESIKLLDEELARAEIVPDGQLPKDVVSMNSKVVFQDLETGKESMVTLVYPHEANMEEDKVSVLAPVGSALIGLKVGDSIKWPMPNGKITTLKVKSVENKR